MWELILFILVGCLGGLVGAWFNGTNERLSIYRMTKMKGRGLRGKRKRPVNTKGHAYREGPMSAFTTPKRSGQYSIDPVSSPLLSDAALEVMCISLAMSIISFGLPSLWSTCTPKPTDTTNLSDQEKVSTAHCSRRKYQRVSSFILCIMPRPQGRQILRRTYDAMMPHAGAAELAGGLPVRPHDALQRAGVALLHGRRHGHQAALPL